MTDAKAAVQLSWDVAMLGPSRVGKTSLLTALRFAGQEFFRGTEIRVEPVDDVTRAAFHRNDNLMKSELASRRFVPDSLGGDIEAHSYGLAVKSGAGEEGFELDLRFHDYPGGWINDNFDAVSDLMRDCPAVLLPVDATLLMETGAEHARLMIDGLAITQVADLVREWGKRRGADGGLAQLILAPVKCESYFADNGGRRNRADDLFAQVARHYGEVIEALRGEYPDARVLYAPVDTIGPIELQDVEWRTEDGVGRMRPIYRVRSDSNGKPLSRSIRGAEPILAGLVADALDILRAAIGEDRESIHGDIEQIKAKGLRARGNWLKRIWDDITDAKSLREVALTQKAAAKALADEDLKKLAARVDVLRASREYTRIRPWP